jgi:hypothetical protein
MRNSFKASLRHPQLNGLETIASNVSPALELGQATSDSSSEHFELWQPPFGVRRQRRPTAALWISAESLAQATSRTVCCKESQSGGVAAALQISIAGHHHPGAPPK